MKSIILCFLSLVFSVAASAQWTPKVRLSTRSVAASLNENMASCLAVSGDTVHVVWSDRHAAGAAIYYRRSVDTGVSWGAEAALTDTFGSGAFPAIAVSGNVVHVVWMDTSLHHRASFYKRSLDGGTTWGATFCLDSNTSFWPGLSASGSMVAVSLNITVATGNTEVFLRTSMNGGATWAPKQQISNAAGRSEDPSVAVQGRHIHLSWNDNRSGTMVIFYRHSADAGATWSPETPMTTLNSYTTMVCLDGAHVDVPYGYNPSSNFDVNMRQSSDTGATFSSAKALASTAATEVYPYLVRSDSQMHMVYQGGGPTYIHSADGGATWSAPVNIGHGGQPFIALSCPVLHVIWPDSGAIYYRRNPTGNPPCVTGTGNLNVASQSNAAISIYPNPGNGAFTLQCPLSAKGTLRFFDMAGRLVYQYSTVVSANSQTVDASELPNGIYFWKIVSENKLQAQGKVIVIK